MWFLSMVQILALAAVGPSTGGNASAPAPTPPANAAEVVFSRQRLFAIPFHIERAASAAEEPVEVQLYVSGDRGATWQLYTKALPAKQQFMFRAGIDGEYWFLVRTLDGSGHLHPDGPGVPGLKVLVDSTPPKVQLQARRGPSGEVVVWWRVDEPYPKPYSLSLRYRASPESPWQPITLERPAPGPEGPVQSGELSLYPPANLAKMELRAEVSDMAGNVGSGQVQVTLNAPPAVAAVAPPAQPKDANSWRAGASDPPPTHWPAANAASPGQVAGNRGGLDADLPPSPLRPSAGAEPMASADPGKLAGQDNSDATAMHSPLRGQLVSENQHPAPATGAATNSTHPSNSTWGDSTAALPPGQRPRMVNSRMFELQYDIQSVGPSGIKQIELWCTRDNGRTWNRVAVDPKSRGPMIVTVAEEGIYGYRMVVQSGAGLGGQPPKSGDAPEIWIGVDLTKPVARITSAEQGSGRDAGTLHIAWEASDNNLLAARPISLSFSQAADGPWTAIATGLENTGHYAWTIAGHAPQQVYLRLEARDEAGNVGVFQTPQPVALDRATPSARILDVRPLGQPSQSPPERNSLR